MCFIYVACICNLGNFGPRTFKSISVRKFGEKKIILSNNKVYNNWEKGVRKRIVYSFTLSDKLDI